MKSIYDCNPCTILSWKKSWSLPEKFKICSSFRRCILNTPHPQIHPGLMVGILVSLGLNFATFSVFHPMLRLTIGKYYLFVNFYNQNLGLTQWSNTPLSFRYTTVRQLITQRSGQAVDSTSWQHNTLLVINWLSDLQVMHQ